MMWVFKSLESLGSWAWKGRGRKGCLRTAQREGSMLEAGRPWVTDQGSRRRSWFVASHAAGIRPEENSNQEATGVLGEHQGRE